MQPKFILTLDGHLRIGCVRMHKDLLLSGRSYDYGKPKWTFVTGKLYVPRDYRGLHIEYDGDSM